MLTSSLDRPRTADRLGTSYAKARGAASGNDAPNRSVRMESRRVARGSRSGRSASIAPTYRSALGGACLPTTVRRKPFREAKLL